MAIELSHEEVSKIIDEISQGGKIVFVKDSSSSKIPVFIKHCSLYDRLAADLIYEQIYDKAVKEGFLTVDQTIQIARDRGLFTEEDEAEIESLRKKIEAQRAVLEKTTRVPARRDRIKSIINSLESKITDVLYKRELLLDNTAERRAQEEKFLYLVWKGTHDPYTDERWWAAKRDFENEKNIEFRHNVFIEYIKLYNGINLETIRYIARSPLWRIRYTTSTKTGADLFGVPVKEYSIDQISICYWSAFYNSVYEMIRDEQPTEEIINDDEALDAFMKNYFEEQKREAIASREGKGKGTGSAWDHGEVIVTKSNPIYEDIDYDKPRESVRNKDKTDLVVRK